MKILRPMLLLFFLVLACLHTVCAKADSMDNIAAASITGPGRVLIVRHALAPGTGDPDHFSIDDCSTQRNLDDRGRKQAREMGQWLRSQGIERARVYTSQWCRCRETAELMKLGDVTELPALNSFFQRWKDKKPNMQALRRFLSEQNMDETLILLVTHQVTITALTGVFPASGTGVLMLLDGKGGFDINRTVSFQ